MKITVINGSPKGKDSITIHTVLYLEKCFPEHEFTIINAASKISYYEKDFSEPEDVLTRADLIIFSYPVYTFLVPGQLHRFIELMKDSGIDLSGKAASQISTSKHFYDVTAHEFVNENCTDMGMNVIRGLSADMEDLLKPEGRAQAEEYMKFVIWSIEMGVYEEPAAFCQPETGKRGNAAGPKEETARLLSEAERSGRPGNVVIVADVLPEDTVLAGLIRDFAECLPRCCRVVNIREFGFGGGCLGCMNCAVSGKCVYTDGFEDLLRENIHKSEAIVYAFTVKDHSMGSRFKMYDDRQFCNGHRTVTRGTPAGYIINGDYYNEPNLKTVVEARCEVGGNFRAGVGTDKDSIRKMADTLNYAIENKYAPPANFYGVGGAKIFRDLIYQVRGLMRADHKFFKANGQYDFPQKKKGSIAAMYLVGALFSNEKLKKKMGGKLSEGMIAPYKKVVEKNMNERNTNENS